MGLVRTLIYLFGLMCIALAVLLGLFALFGYLVSEDTGGRVVACVLGGLALLLSILGLLAIRHRKRHLTVASSQATKPPVSPHVGLEYADFTWGTPPPSLRQFRYAMHVGADIRNGMTKWMMSDVIDEVIEQQRSGEPASKDQLQIIKEYHGVLPRAVTRGEANRLIEFLENYSLPCPFCGIEICAIDDECCACEKKLARMKIPLKL